MRGPDTMLFDDFERPDGAIGAAVTGQPWRLDSGIWEIRTGAAELIGSGAGAAAVPYIFSGDAGSPDGVLEVTFTWGSSSNALGAVFRLVDWNNYLVLYLQTNGWWFQRRLAGTSGTAGITQTAAPAFAAVRGNTYSLRVEAQGSLLTASLDGGPVVEASLSADLMTTFGTATRVGFEVPSLYDRVHSIGVTP